MMSLLHNQLYTACFPLTNIEVYLCILQNKASSTAGPHTQGSRGLDNGLNFEYFFYEVATHRLELTISGLVQWSSSIYFLLHNNWWIMDLPSSIIAWSGHMQISMYTFKLGWWWQQWQWQNKNCWWEHFVVFVVPISYHYLPNIQ